MSGTGADQLSDSANTILGSSNSGNISDSGKILNTARKLSTVSKKLLDVANKKLARTLKSQ